jgi:L-seryl-tRNA(Ser) seleniumtransferase
VAAVERYLKIDHAAERRVLNERATRIMDVLAGIEGVGAAVDVPEIANHVPHVLVRWEEEAKNLSSENALARLVANDPPIHVIREGPGVLRLSTWTLRDGEAEILAGRVKVLFV